MGLFSNQFANVVEWEEWNEEMVFWKWTNREIKKGSRLIIRPGQDAIFLYNGKIDGVFTEDGDYDIESEIIPFLSTLKGIKFGFNSGMRAEVLFVNTKEFLMKRSEEHTSELQPHSDTAAAGRYADPGQRDVHVPGLGLYVVDRKCGRRQK